MCPNVKNRQKVRKNCRFVGIAVVDLHGQSVKVCCHSLLKLFLLKVVVMHLDDKDDGGTGGCNEVGDENENTRFDTLFYTQ